MIAKQLTENFLRRMAHAAIVAMAVLIAAGCSLTGSNFQEPRIALISIRSLPVEGLSLPFEAVIQVENPNDYPLTLNSLRYTLTLEGHELVTGHQSVVPTMPAHAATEITVPAKLSLLGGVSLASDLLSKRRQQLQYRLLVSMDVDKFWLPTINVEKADSIHLAPR